MKINDVVKIKPNSNYYDNKTLIPSHIINDKWIVMSIKGDRVIIYKNISATENYESYVNTGVISFTLNKNIFDALTSFCYNCGNGNLKP